MKKKDLFREAKILKMVEFLRHVWSSLFGSSLVEDRDGDGALDSRREHQLKMWTF